ncbi:hypothetical protein ACHAXR_004569 [Thalassiosira sp. AJA248-18]
MPRNPPLCRDETPLEAHRRMHAQEVPAVLFMEKVTDPLPRVQGRELSSMQSGEGSDPTGSRREDASADFEGGYYLFDGDVDESQRCHEGCNRRSAGGVSQAGRGWRSGRGHAGDEPGGPRDDEPPAYGNG